MPETLRSLITSKDQPLRSVFNAQRSYYIDIYQREYKWTDKNVLTLLNDIEVRFSEFKQTESEPEEIKNDVLQRFSPYFLNTYLTSTVAATTFIVDGQQRLTTFLLILIKLYRVLKKVEGTPENRGRTFSSKVVEQLIFETNDFGAPGRFKIFNENREAAFQALVEGKSVETTDQTRTRIAENFKAIDHYFDVFLKNEQGEYDLAKTTYYLAYLLDMVSIIEIRIERQENVAMIFEVVNDRGLGLNPYEILKGKLIGNLSAKQKEIANEVWTDLQERYFQVRLKNTTESMLSLDMFFQVFFRARFADSESEYERFERDYHYEIYRNQKVRAYFGEFRDKNLLFKRITEDIRYFAELYLELRTSYDHEALVFNKLLDQNHQYLLILSAMERNDPERMAKIDGIAAKFDQLHVVLRLLGAYDSSAFQRLVYPLTKDVRKKSLAAIKPIFDAALLESLEAKEIIPLGQFTTATEIFEFERFKGVHNARTNFSKYVLLRIDRWLSSLLDKPSYAAGDLEEIENRFNKNNRRRHGMHLEHIYTRHPTNCALFKDVNNAFDEERFNRTRNLLGMVLLLKDSQNLSSNNEVYAGKVATYSQSNLIWNELLVGHLASVDLRNLPCELRFPPILPVDDVFPLDQVDNRQKALFEVIRHIWAMI